jgi:hypothetical protein
MQFYGPRTQILDTDSAVNTTTIVYTVPAGKKFYLIWAKTLSDGGAAGTVYAAIRDGGAVEQTRIGRRDASGADDFQPGWPIELPATWDIVIVSGAALLTGELDIFGYEVDA